MKLKLLALAAAIGVVAAGAFFAMPSQAATNQLYLMQNCRSDGSVRLDFSWKGNDPSANQQWLDLSLFNNGWDWGTFLGAGPMPASQQSLRWEGLISGTTHYVRLNQLMPNGVWDQSVTWVFTTIDCTPQPPAQPAPSPDRVRVPAPIDDLKVLPSGNGSTYNLVVKAGLPGGCAQKDTYEVNRNGNDFNVKVWNTEPTGEPVCTAIYGTYELTIPLGTLPAGQTVNFHVNDKTISWHTP
jgi:hypothetical protein